MTPFRVLCADPAWPFDDRLPGKKRGAASHYPTMTVDQICAFPLPPLEKNSLLFLWRVASMQEEALQVIRAWGFKLKSEVVWKKLTRKGGRHFGMGRYVRAEHETCLVAVRGKVEVANRSIRSVFEAPVGRHSEKPEAFYLKIVEQLSPGPYCELFARRAREGWTTLGNEMGGAP